MYLTINSRDQDWSNISQFQVLHYKLYRNDRIKGGEGIVVYVRDNIAAIRRRKSGESLECILLDVYMNNKRIAILCAYKQLSVDNATFSKELSTMLDEALSFSDTVICTGDQILIYSISSSSRQKRREMLAWCLWHVLTRISKTRESCLDVILTNASALIKSSGVLEPGLSDHRLVYAVLNSKLPLPKSEMVMKRSMKRFNQEAFLEDLKSHSLLLTFLMIQMMCIGVGKNFIAKFLMIMLLSFLSRKVKLLDPNLLQPIFRKRGGKEIVSRRNLINLGAQMIEKIAADLEIKLLVWEGREWKSVSLNNAKKRMEIRGNFGVPFHHILIHVKM